MPQVVPRGRRRGPRGLPNRPQGPRTMLLLVSCRTHPPLVMIYKLTCLAIASHCGVFEGAGVVGWFGVGAWNGLVGLFWVFGGVHVHAKLSPKHLAMGAAGSVGKEQNAEQKGDGPSKEIGLVGLKAEVAEKLKAQYAKLEAVYASSGTSALAAELEAMGLSESEVAGVLGTLKRPTSSSAPPRCL